MDDTLLYVLPTRKNCRLLHELMSFLSSDSSYSTFLYSAGQHHSTYDDRIVPPMINVDVQDEQAFMSRFTFNFPNTGIQADHSPQHHAWHGSHGGYGSFLPEASSYTMPNQPFTNGGMPPPFGFETQIVSDPQPSVSYPGYGPVSGGYQYPTPAGTSTEYGSPFAMPQHPMVPQTQTVYHVVPDTHPPFASATSTPVPGTTSAPVVLNMALAPGQDIVIDATIDFVHPHPTETPLPASVPSIAASASPRSSSEPVPEVPSLSVVRCMIDNCRHDIEVDKVILRTHLTNVHGYPAPHRSRSVLCRWSGCICTRPSTCRSPNLGVGHGVHIEDITEHIWTTHLNFQDVCSKCGDARWVHGFSLQRHMSGCAGRKPARCKGCRIVFKSTVALAGHMELGLCEAAMNE
jgi:hypothetical protein